MSNFLFNWMREQDRLRGQPGAGPDPYTVSPENPSVRFGIGAWGENAGRFDANIGGNPMQRPHRNAVSDPTFEARRAHVGPPPPPWARIPR